jgi:hypothetical protein
MHHPAAANFQPFLAALEGFRFHIDLETRLGERKIVRPETHFGVGTEQFAQEIFERAFEIRHAHPLIDVKTFDLVKLRAVSCIDFIAAKGRARRDHAKRRRCGFHRANLHRRGVGSKQSAIRQIKRVLFIPCRMVGRGIERIEAMPFVLHVRTFRERETHPSEDAYPAIQHLGERMQRPNLVRGSRKRNVDLRKRARFSGGPQFFARGLNRRIDRAADFVQQLADDIFHSDVAFAVHILTDARADTV